LLDPLDRLERPVAVALDAWRRWILGAILAVYLGIAGLLAHYKLFWNDELFTVYIARIPTVPDVWAFLATGVEQTPPTFHLLSRWVIHTLGEHHVTVRLPSILAVGVLGICLFVVVSRRTSPAYGFIAMLFPLTTQAFLYAYEARPYALVLAFSAASLLCWTSAADGRRRALSLAVLAVTLAAALCSHYYAVLVFLPLAAGELARSLDRRRVDLGIWLAFSVATIPLFVFLPLIQSGRKLAATFWARPQWQQMADFYQHVLSPASVPLLVIVLGLAVYGLARASDGGKSAATGAAPPPRHEIVAALGYLALPVVAVLVAKLVTGAFTDRYALPAVLGVAIIVSWGAHQLLDHRATLGAILAALLTGWFVAFVGVIPALQLRQVRAEPQRVYRFLQTAAPGDQPVVIAGPHSFFELTYYAPPALASRLAYLVDPAAALHYVGTDTVDLGMREFGRRTGLRVEPYRTYLSTHPRFLLYVDRSPWNWLLPALSAAGARFEVVALDGPGSLYLVQPGPDATSAR
jgi:4-amino-4-deoxy-L-arabinose transferase-like glycosyltransferase